MIPCRKSDAYPALASLLTLSKNGFQQEYNLVPFGDIKYPELDIYINSLLSRSFYVATDKTLSWSRENQDFPKIDSESTVVYFYMLMCRLIGDPSAPVNGCKHEILVFWSDHTRLKISLDPCRLGLCAWRSSFNKMFKGLNSRQRLCVWPAVGIIFF